MFSSHLHPYLEQALAEHRHLHEEIEAVSNRLVSKNAAEANHEDCQQVQQLLSDLVAELRKHFQQEEAGGYLEEAIALRPALSSQANGLQRQHAILLLHGEQLLRHVRSDQDPQVTWCKLQEAVPRFLTKLLAHETAENRLLERAFNTNLDLNQ